MVRGNVLFRYLVFYSDFCGMEKEERCFARLCWSVSMRCAEVCIALIDFGGGG